jgi:two-component system, cell cycle sensor histidine kinase and response regulator CckA
MKKIIILDDNQDMLHIYARLLSREGFEVLTATTAAEFRELCSHTVPEMLLLDVMLPDGNGIELLKEVKARPEFQRCLVVLLSGLVTDTGSKVRGLAAGAVDFIQRPIPNQEIVAKVKSLMQVMEVEQALVDVSNRLEEVVAEKTRVLERTICSLSREVQAVAEAKALLSASEARFSAAFYQAPQIMTITEIETGRFLEVNGTFCRLSGLKREEVVGKSSVEVGWIRSDTREKLRAALADQGQVRDLEIEVFAKDGTVIHSLYSGAIITVGGEQKLLSMGTDLTAVRRAEERHQELENQLRQAQKLESVGRLAGGVAHDFNNKLSVILGHAELAAMKLPADSGVREHLEEIIRATENSRVITSQLLIFSRRDVIKPRLLDVQEEIGQIGRSLQRLLGEDIVITIVADDQLWGIMMDPVQLDQVVLNMAVNARDAMPDGGTFTIRAENVSIAQGAGNDYPGELPGEYVQFSFRDSGVGMAKETLEHIFEPFFTTKSAGMGTGLGLATVYGIAARNGGCVRVASTVGEGTEFKVILPRHYGASAPKCREPDPVRPGRGTVLVVEDEEPVRNITEMMLNNLGYRVLNASSPSEALKLMRTAQQAIDLLLVDVVMPEMSGPVLAGKMMLLRPEVKVLFMSGYPSRYSSSDPGFSDEEFLQKPFSIQEISRKLEGIFRVHA